MTRKQESLKKARESWKEFVESWKELIKSWKEFWNWAFHVIKWTIISLIHLLEWWYHVIDAWDKAIWEKIEKKQAEKWKNPWKISRFLRDYIMKLVVALSITGYGWYKAIEISKDKQENKIESEVEDKVGDKVEEVIEAESKWSSNDTLLIPTKEYSILSWKTITTSAPLTRIYLGGDASNSWDLVIGEILALNPANSLHNLWTLKIQKYGQSTKDISELDARNISGMTPEQIEEFKFKYPIDATYLFVVKPYIDGQEARNTMTLEQFIEKTNQIVNDLKTKTEEYDWWLEGNKKKLFDAIREDINWESIVAYAMTELCENKEDWEFNKELFDILLRNCWTNYLEKVPAVYDWKTSYWLYQFTEYALYEREWEKRWASKVNTILPKDEKIEGSVIGLNTREDQTKAAYMFAIYNLSAAVKKLTDQQAKDLLAYQKSDKENFRDNITQLIAMCHHMPVASKFLKQWHEDKHRKDIYNYGKAHTKPYWRASKRNYNALKK